MAPCYIVFGDLSQALKQNLISVEPVYYGHLGTSKKCPDYQGVLIFQVILCDEVHYGTSATCVDYPGVLNFKCSH